MDVDNTDKNTHVMLLVVICIKVLKICHSYFKKIENTDIVGLLLERSYQKAGDFTHLSPASPSPHGVILAELRTPRCSLEMCTMGSQFREKGLFEVSL